MREAPYSEFAERAIIGSIVLDQTQYHAIRRILSAGDFYTERNRRIFEAMEKIIERGDSVDAVSIHTEMTSAGTVGKLGGIAYLSEMVNDCIPIHSEQYARTVRDFAIRRNIILTGQIITDDGFNLKIEQDDLIGRTRKAVLSACEATGTDTAVPVKESIQGAVDSSQRDTPPEGVVYTGIPSIDSFGGLWAGCLSILGARPSMGKSAVALNIAANAALAGKKVLYVSLEDVALFLQYRLLARFSKVDSKKLRDRTMNHEEKMRVGDAKDIVGCLPLWIDDSGGRTAVDIRRAVLLHQDRVGCDLVIIDHLAHVSRQGTEYDALTSAVMNLGEIPKEINAPVLLLSQLNREVEKRGDRSPQLSDLRGTGEIEQRARTVWFLDYPRAYKPDANPNELNFSCAKNTHGTIGFAKLHVNFAQMHICDWKGDGESMKPWTPPERSFDREY